MMYMCAYLIFTAPMHRDLSWSSCLPDPRQSAGRPTRRTMKNQSRSRRSSHGPGFVEQLATGQTWDITREAIEQVQNWKRKSNKSSFGCKSWKIYSDLLTLFDQRIIGKRWDVTSQNLVFSAVNIYIYR